MILISTHAPTEVAKEDFCSSLGKVCDEVPNYYMKTILGDFNVNVVKQSYLYSAGGGHNLHNKTNDIGKWIVNFALARNLAVTGTWYQYQDIHNVTWTSPDNKTCNQIKHILVDRRHCMNVCDVRSVRGAEIESDHYFSEGQN